MIKITVIAMGKIKEKYLCEACDEYVKRLSRYCDITVCEVPAENLPDSPSDGEIEAALLKEAVKIEKLIPKNSIVTALCVEGVSLTSEQFAERIDKAVCNGDKLCFIIGSSYGLSSKIKQMADIKLSLSKMTFPHRLFRVMLLEQIYRGFKINEGGTYHK